MAVLLVAALLLQTAPCSFEPAFAQGGDPDRTGPSFLKALTVCDDGIGAAGFLYDNPCIPDGAVTFSSYVVKTAIGTAERIRLSEGFPSSVFKPPRSPAQR